MAFDPFWKRALLALGLTSIVGPTVAAPGTASWADTALLADFKRVCVDTALEPARVHYAAIRVGGVLKREGELGGHPVTFWTHTIDGKRIDFQLQDLSRDPRASFSAVCAADDFNEADGRSLPGLRRWLRAPADYTQNQFRFAALRFAVVDGQPQLVDDSQRHALGSAGPEYRITVMAGQQGTHVTLSRFK